MHSRLLQILSTECHRICNAADEKVQFEHILNLICISMQHEKSLSFKSALLNCPQIDDKIAPRLPFTPLSDALVD